MRAIKFNIDDSVLHHQQIANRESAYQEQFGQHQDRMAGHEEQMNRMKTLVRPSARRHYRRLTVGSSSLKIWNVVLGTPKTG
jgi:hypothetical protein